MQSLGERDHITLVTQRVLEAVLAIVNMRRVRERGQQWVNYENWVAAKSHFCSIR